jgi:hypothetical protein
MFHLLGSDGKEYGPVSAEVIRQWLREGRAGGTTLTRTVASTAWQPLSALPDFADLLRPVAATDGLASATGATSLPASVRWLATGMFVVAAVGGLVTLVHLPGLLRALMAGGWQPGLFFWLSWGVAILSLPLRVALGVGLGRGRRWAYWTALIFSGAMLLNGGWGLAQTARWWLTPDTQQALISSPLFWLNKFLSLAIWFFNLATLFILLRRPARAAFLGAKTMTTARAR